MDLVRVWFPEVLNVDIIDDVIAVSEEIAYQTMKDISRNEGLLVGMSSRANVYAALQIAKEIGRGKTIVIILSGAVKLSLLSFTILT